MVRLFKVALGAVLISLVGSIHAHAAAINGTPPHSLCTTPIGQYEARIWTGPDRTGICRPLEFVPGGSNTVAVDSFGDPWVSWDAPYGFPNDAVSSAETGSGVYLVLFWNSFGTQDNGAALFLPPNYYSHDLGSWKGRASAARLQTFPANACADKGKIILFTDYDYTGDCTELDFHNRCYPDATSMGFRNDTLTSYWNSTGTLFELGFADVLWNQGGLAYQIPFYPNGGIANLSQWNDNDILTSVDATQGYTYYCNGTRH